MIEMPMISHVVHLDVSIVLRIAPTLWISISSFLYNVNNIYSLPILINRLLVPSCKQHKGHVGDHLQILINHDCKFS